MPELIRRGWFVASEVTDLYSDEFPLIIQHHRISRITYPNEWCPEALRQAALLALDLQDFLMTQGYTLCDFHPWNMLYENGQPIYVDLDAIQPLNEKWPWHCYWQFLRFYLYPLKWRLWAVGAMCRCCSQISTMASPMQILRFSVASNAHCFCCKTL